MKKNGRSGHRPTGLPKRSRQNRSAIQNRQEKRREDKAKAQVKKLRAHREGAQLNSMLSGLFSGMEKRLHDWSALNEEYGRRKKHGESLILRSSGYRKGRGAYPWDDLHRFQKNLGEWYVKEKRRIMYDK